MGNLLQLKKAPPGKAAIIDEYGTIDALRKQFAPTEKRFEQLRDEIKSWFDDADPEATFIERSEHFQLNIGVRANVTTVQIAKVFKKLGVKRFLEICSVTLKALAAAIPECEIDAVTDCARTGSRSISTMPIVGAPKAA